MTTVFTKAFLLVILLALAPALAAAQAIHVTPTVLDLGRMPQDTQVTRQVTVTNQGAGLLRIDGVEADCGCTVPTLTVNTLGYGESTVVDVRFDSEKFHGKVVKMVHIKSNDPQNSTVTVTITARVETPLIIDPGNQRVGFSQCLSGDVRMKKVTFTATQQDQLEIQAGTTRKGLFQTNVINGVDGDPRISVLEITLPADMPPGKHRDGVRVTTNVEEKPYVDIDVRGWIVQRLFHSPDAVKFRYKSEFKASVRVAPKTPPLEFKVTGAELDLPEIQVEVREVAPNMLTQVHLKGKPIAKDDPRAVEAGGRITGTLVIYTDLEDVPRIEVPVSYMIRM